MKFCCLQGGIRSLPPLELAFAEFDISSLQVWSVCTSHMCVGSENVTQFSFEFVEKEYACQIYVNCI